MSNGTYEVNKPVKVIFHSLCGETGITDLAVTLYDPDNVSSSLGNMTDIGNGLYEIEFTPNKNGRWYVLIASTLSPLNATKESYFVGGIEHSKYRLQLERQDTNIDFSGDTWYTVFDINAEGRPTYLWTEFYTGNYEIRITMDGENVFELNNQEMGWYDMADANQVSDVIGVLYRRSADVISWHFPTSLTFDTQFKYEVRRRSGDNRGLDRAILQWEKRY